MTDRPPSPLRRLRACAPCTKVKARCHFTQEHVARHLCERCDKMGIACSPKTTRSLRKPKRIKSAHGENCAAPVMTSQPNAYGNASTMTTEHHVSAGTETLGSAAAPIVIETQRNTEVVEGAKNNRQRLPKNPSLRQDHPPLGLSWEQVDRILATFRNKYMPAFPFVLIDESKPPQQLHSERPFVLRAIMLVAAPLSVPRISKMRRNVLAYMSQQVFVEENKSLDILQGILICLAWAHVCGIREEQVLNLSHLALGYAHSLGITKVPRQSGIKGSSRVVGDEGSASVVANSHSPEEQRALLGLFCIHSVTSAHTTMRNPLDGPYPEMCRASLCDTSTSPQDLLLDRLVRLVRMGEKLSQGFGEPHERDQSRSYVFLLEGSGRGFRSDLNRLMEFAAHPDVAEHQSLFQLYLHYLVVRLYEPAIIVIDRPQDGVPPSRYRCLCMRNCLDAVKDFLEIVISLPLDASLYESIITTSQTSFVMLMGARLLLVEALDWDVALARQRLELRHFLDKIIDRAIEAEALRARAAEDFAAETGIRIVGGETQVESKLVETARKTRWLRDWYEARLQGRQTEMEWSPAETAFTERGDGPRGERAAPPWFNGLLGNGAWNFDP